MNVPLTPQDPISIMGSQVIAKTNAILTGYYWYHTADDCSYKIRPDGTMRESGTDYMYYDQEFYDVRYSCNKDLFS